MDSFVLYCPICRKDMTQVAPGVHQCGVCMYGPSTLGSRDYLCFADIEMGVNQISALSFRYRSKKLGYSVCALTWGVDDDGKFVGGASRLSERLLGYETDPVNFANLPLPVVVLGRDKWDFAPNTPCLVRGMFSSPLGEKLRVLSIGPAGKSGSRPFLIAPGEHYQEP